MNAVKSALRFSLPIALVMVLGFSVFSGWRGGLGAVVGIGVGDFDIYCLGVFSQVVLSLQPGPRVIRLALMFLLLKLPLLFAAILLATRLGSPAIASFLAGIGLVYCLLIQVASREAVRQKRDHFS